MKKHLFTFRDFAACMSDNNISAHAAACAFYTFLSLVPFVGIVTAVIPYTGLSRDTLMYHVSKYIPEATQTLINGTIDDIYLASGAVLPVTVILTVYLASRAFSALIRGLEVISGSRKFASFFRRSLLACIYTLALVAAMLIVLAILVFGKQLVGLIAEDLPFMTPALEFLIRGRIVLVFIVLSCVFMLIYRGVPGMKLGFLKLLPGAAASSLAWLAFTWLFSLFLRFGGTYTTYGNLAAIVISLLWMYWCMYIILSGAQLNIFISGKNGKKP